MAVFQPDHEQLAEEYEQSRINALSPDLQALVDVHHTNQFEAVPCYVEGQAAEFVQLCNALGIVAEKE